MAASHRVEDALPSRLGLVQNGLKCKDIKTDCSVNTQIQGKTYCFGNQSALTQFMADPSGNLTKAQAYYSKKQPG